MSVAEAKAALLAHGERADEAVRASVLAMARKYALPLVIGSAALGLVLGRVARRRKGEPKGGSVMGSVVTAAAKQAIPIVLPFAVEWLAQKGAKRRDQAQA